MLRINEWQVKSEQKLACGHTVARGTVSYTISFVVCPDDVTCMPQMIQACFQSLKTQSQALWHPPLLYRLWHFLWGKKQKQGRSESNQVGLVGAVTSLPEEDYPNTMAQTKRFTARRELTLDCGHTVKAGEVFQVTSTYTCQQEGNWPLRILLACFAAQKQQSVTKPTAQTEKPPAKAK